MHMHMHINMYMHMCMCMFIHLFSWELHVLACPGDDGDLPMGISPFHCLA